jgi:alginate O-acetyltransferase complex protein AlgI
MADLSLAIFGNDQFQMTNYESIFFSVPSVTSVANSWAVAFPATVFTATPAAWPRWLFMWLLALAIYFACKLLTWSAAATAGVPAWRQAAYLFAWPGLDAQRFFDSSRCPPRPSASEWFAAILKTMLGAIVFWGAHYIVPTGSILVLGWAGIVGAGFILHFGLFHLLSCFWRAVGADAHALMNAPLRSTSVAEFWSKRWNTAFRDLTHAFLFRPLSRRWGLQPALAISFVFSGLVHDLVISLPAGGGFGGPTAFFILQAIAILVEKSQVGKLLGLGRGLRGWTFTALVLLGPATLLFHRHFITAIVVPFMKALGAA